MADQIVASGPGESPLTDFAKTESASATHPDSKYLPVERLRRQFEDYLQSKQDEIKEQKTALRYYHSAQWTERERKAFKKRKQPVVTFNRIERKINAVVGLVERLRQDPKAYPRTPQEEQGADLATAALRYQLDQCDWKSKTPICALNAGVTGIGGLELELEPGDHGDPTINAHVVDFGTYFYDPRSVKQGFSDARYMGTSKWMDLDAAKDLIGNDPVKSELLEALVDTGTDLTIDTDHEKVWVNSNEKKIRVVDHWYLCKGEWCWALYVANTILLEGISPFRDEKKRTFPRYVMFSANTDHDGDRYGFVRNLQSPQDEVNQRRSKGLHIANSRRLIIEEGAVDDIEKARAEWARPDGVIVVKPGMKATPDNTQADLQAQIQFLQEAKNEIENFGPNPAVVGQGLEDSSGRAIALLQQAGIAELGPYILSYRSWKLRVYRAFWNIMQQHWTAERWIRVTDDENLAKFIKLNGVGVDPQTGLPVLVNAIGSLDVDIIIDEGPDAVNVMADTFETLAQLVKNGVPVPPEVIVETSSLPLNTKQKVLGMLQQAKQPDPKTEAAKDIELAAKKAEVLDTHAHAISNVATAYMNAAKAGQSVPPQDGWVAADAIEPQPSLPSQPSAGPVASRRPSPGPQPDPAMLPPVIPNANQNPTP